MKLAPLADAIAKQINPADSWDDIRDECDLASGGDFDTMQLDILTDMVASRVLKAAYKEKGSQYSRRLIPQRT
ncbi:MAG: hypothetical protein ETSY1_43050 [Candidatus Entotheonella factor]|uniref:Uncharacterized protein n=1 Tax=Entotheonella factor TaxID=1429438 RepID=W4L4H1_ENTF1|nr:MAG: hypothetical protein ETSY1_43050 [Candidatus Entotheonella factor]